MEADSEALGGGVRTKLEAMLRDLGDAVRPPLRGDVPKEPLPEELMDVAVVSTHSAAKAMRNGRTFTGLLDEVMRKKQGSNRKEGRWRCCGNLCERDLEYEYESRSTKIFESQRVRQGRDGVICLDAEVRPRGPPPPFRGARDRRAAATNGALTAARFLRDSPPPPRGRRSPRPTCPTGSASGRSCGTGARRPATPAARSACRCPSTSTGTRGARA